MSIVNHKRIILVVFCFMSLGLYAQQQEYIIGKLLDANTNEPVVFANIRIKDKALGVITNIDGSFRIPLRYKDYGDLIEVSSMGYQTKEIPIKDFLQEGINLILLNPSAIGLQEAVVKAKDKRGKRLGPKRIVQKAIAAIPSNYPKTSFSTIGYYRDYQLNDGDYINLNEGIMEVYDQGFDQLDDVTSEIQLFNFELNKDFEIDTMARMAYNYENYKKIIKKAYLGAYGGNEFRILRIHDAIRNYNVFSYDYIGTLKNDLIENHIFLRSKDSESDGESLYGIKFWKRYPNYRAHGEIFIAKSDFAIHKLEYTMYDEKKRNDTGQKNKHGHRQKVIFDISTDYRKVNNKMYLNYISFHNSFTLNIPPVFNVEYITVNTDRRCFVVEYNNIPESKPAMHLPNYQIEFKKKRVKLKTAQRLKNKIYLYPDMDNDKIDQMMGTITAAQRAGEDLNDLIEVQVSNVRDTIGNLVNQWSQREYNQFREFFTQRIKPDSRAPFDGQFMDKKKPIFNDQPVIRPKNFEDFWMNTPLKENIN